MWSKWEVVLFHFPDMFRLKANKKTKYVLLAFPIFKHYFVIVLTVIEFGH